MAFNLHVNRGTSNLAIRYGSISFEDGRHCPRFQATSWRSHHVTMSSLCIRKLRLDSWTCEVAKLCSNLNFGNGVLSTPYPNEYAGFDGACMAVRCCLTEGYIGAALEVNGSRRVRQES